MNGLAALNGWWQSDAVLPALALTRWSVPASWALVLAALACHWTRARSLRTSVLIMALLVTWAMLPAPGAAGRVLGLAFQAPSLLTLVWSASVVAQRLRPGALAWSPTPSWVIYALCALGWVLLLDTFALTPVSVYAWGFRVPLLVAVAVVGAVALMVSVTRPPATCGTAWVLVGCLGLYVVTRLPTGNVWDALLDPWLWLILQGRLLGTAFRAWRARVATRAAAARLEAATGSQR